MAPRKASKAATEEEKDMLLAIRRERRNAQRRERHARSKALHGSSAGVDSLGMPIRTGIPRINVRDAANAHYRIQKQQLAKAKVSAGISAAKAATTATGDIVDQTTMDGGDGWIDYPDGYDGDHEYDSGWESTGGDSVLGTAGRVVKEVIAKRETRRRTGQNARERMNNVSAMARITYSLGSIYATGVFDGCNCRKADKRFVEITCIDILCKLRISHCGIR